MNNKVCIIMVTKDHPEDTIQALETLREHTKSEHYHLYLIDNGSSPETLDKIYAQIFGYDMPADMIPLHENLGPQKSVEIGYDLAIEHDYQFVLACHNDIQFCKQWLENMIRRFDDPTVGAVGPVITYCMGMQKPEIALATFGCKPNFLVHLFLLARTSVLKQIEYRDLDAAYPLGDKAEIEFCHRISEAGYTFEIARDVVIKHKGESTFVDTLGSKENFYQYQNNNEKILRSRLGEDIVNKIFTIHTSNAAKVLVCIPTRTSHVHTYFFASMLMLYAKSAVNREVMHMPRTWIVEARNKFVEYAIENDFTHVLMIDDDMVFDGDTLNRLLAHDVDICSGVAFQRAEPYCPCVFKLNETEGVFNPIEAAHMGFGEVDAIGGYFLLVKTNVFKTIEKPYFSYADRTLGLGEKTGGIGEDLYFCTKAKRAGFKVWVDSDIIIRHIGVENIVDEKTYANYKNNGSKTKEMVLS